jgi:hypothetical protein
VTGRAVRTGDRVDFHACCPCCGQEVLWHAERYVWLDGPGYSTEVVYEIGCPASLVLEAA